MYYTPVMSRKVVVDTSKSPNAMLCPMPIDRVRLSDSFWEPRREINRTVTLPSQHQHCEDTHRIDNFRIASGRKSGPFVGIYFNDSDVYKWLEASASSLATHPDPNLAKMVDATVDEIAAAQQPDGYLNTYFTGARANERWTDLRDKHELYCAGHLIQAAVAHVRATGSDRLMQVATRLADHIVETFGPENSGKRQGCCGHEEIEMALIELYRETRANKYLELAKHFLDARGRGLIGGGEYHQDHVPVRDQHRAAGHAVRQMYLACGMADLCAEVDDPPMRDALSRLWSNMSGRQMYVTGGIGSRHEGESFGRDFELPNERAYAETCAAIGSIMWNWRMLQIARDDTERARYADVIELQLYNAMLAGLSLDGTQYFYQNPLADDGSHRRAPWFGCACCPPNLARVLAQLPGYLYGVAKESDAIYVHLYAQGSADITLSSGARVRLEVSSGYPFDGAVEFRVTTENAVSLKLRIPGWCKDARTIFKNQASAAAPGSYATVNIPPRSSAVVQLELPMPARFLECHPHVAENVGRVALARGPFAYCAEEVDNPGLDLRDVRISTDGAQVKHEPDLLGGLTTITVPDAGVKFIPYYAWANRLPGRMQVWMRRDGLQE
jgi:DUF1680 family protein